MSDWKSRIIQSGEGGTPDDLPAEFVAEIRSAQIEGNSGWAPDMDDLIDRRVVYCPDCGAGGMNTTWGYWRFTCGAEILTDGEPSVPCPSPAPVSVRR